MEQTKTTPEEVLELRSRMDDAEERSVRQLGDAIGYGRLMQLAEHVWRNKLAAEGMEGGEITSGPCAAFMVRCMHPVKDDHGHCDVCCGSGRVTKYVASITQQGAA